MTQETESNEAGVPDKNATGQVGQTIDPVRRFTRWLLIVATILFIWYVLADRFAPWTDQARVQAYVVPIVSKVPGRVQVIYVQREQLVDPGELLVQIDPTEYEIAVKRAESELELAGQDTGAETAEVSSAQANVVDAKVHLEHMQTQAARIIEVEKRGAVSRAEGDQARAAVKQARARLELAESDLEKAKQQLGKEGTDNPRVRAAVADLKQARIDLAETKIYAPSRGVITNLIIDDGHYAQTGAPLMTFVSANDVWVQANIRENSIDNIKIGAAVDIALDVAPGRTFTGTVSSIGLAVEQSSTGGELGGLSEVKGKSGWMRQAQRFPVTIHFDNNNATGLRRVGGQADVQFYGGSSILNGLGWIWIRLMSVVSYIY